MITNGTVFARRCGTRDGMREAALFGLVETRIGILREHRVRGMIAMSTTSGVAFVPTGYERDVVEDDEVHACTIDALLRAQIWTRPTEGGLSGGGIMFRRTAAPAPAGHEVHMMIGAMVMDPTMIADATLHAVSGTIGGWADGDGTTPPGRIRLAGAHACPNPTNGTTPAQILRMPMWGWHGEPWGLLSTMDMASNTICEELDDLYDLQGEGRISEEGAARLERLRRTTAGSAVARPNADTDYDRFKRAWRRQKGPRAWNGVRTASEHAREFGEMAEIIRGLGMGR